MMGNGQIGFTAFYADQKDAYQNDRSDQSMIDTF